MKFTNLRGEVRPNEPLSGHTSFRIGGPADALVLPEDRDDLIALLAEVREQGIPYVVLGGGTNLLVRDGGYRGVVISLNKMAAIEVAREYRSVGGSFAVVHADAGAVLARLLGFSVERGLTGLEFATGIAGADRAEVVVTGRTWTGMAFRGADWVTIVK